MKKEQFSLGKKKGKEKKKHNHTTINVDKVYRLSWHTQFQSPHGLFLFSNRVNISVKSYQLSSTRTKWCSSPPLWRTTGENKRKEGYQRQFELYLLMAAQGKAETQYRSMAMKETYLLDLMWAMEENPWLMCVYTYSVYLEKDIYGSCPALGQFTKCILHSIIKIHAK